MMTIKSALSAIANSAIAKVYGKAVYRFVENWLKPLLTDWQFWLCLGIASGLFSLRHSPPPIGVILSDHRFWLLSVSVAIFVLYAKQRPSGYSLLGLAAYILALAGFNLWTFVPGMAGDDWRAAADNLILMWEYWALGLNAVLVMYLAVVMLLIFKPIHKADLLAKVIWGILFINETWSLGFENFTCNIVYSTPGSEVIDGMLGHGQSIYACGRIFGDNVVWIPTALSLAVILWAVVQHARAKDRMT